MYTLLGLIQMLMLTQMRLMPDLEGLFKATPMQTEAVTHFAGTQQLLTTTAAYRADVLTIRRKRAREKQISPFPERSRTPQLSKKEIFRRTRVLSADRLYLVFCQWKTEG